MRLSQRCRGARALLAPALSGVRLSSGRPHSLHAVVRSAQAHPPTIRNVGVSHDRYAGHVEPCLVLNPRNRRNLLGTAHLVLPSGATGPSAFVSFDGGITWHESWPLPLPPGYTPPPGNMVEQTRQEDATMAYAADFGPREGRIWLNCAHQGPLPRVAVAAAQEALAWKVAPHHLSDALFEEVPRRMRAALGRLLNVPAEDIILGNSTSYGLHLLANGLPWRSGDEVLLVDGDYPADVLPWLALQRHGVRVRFIRSRGVVAQPDEIAAALTLATRLFCTTWVNSFSGHAIDLYAVGALCRANGTLCIINGSQAVGARPLDLATTPIDALVCCGYKWLCGPYATGFCWIRPEVRARLEYNQAYWLAMQAGRSLDHMRDTTVRTDLGARQYDVFCPANFLDLLPWAAAVEYLLAQGIAQIAAHDDGLVTRLIASLDPDRYTVLSPREGPARSTLVLVSHASAERNPAIQATLQREGIDTALREGQIRFSPHLYNTEDDVDHALRVLATA